MTMAPSAPLCYNGFILTKGENMKYDYDKEAYKSYRKYQAQVLRAERYAEKIDKKMQEEMAEEQRQAQRELEE